MMNNYICSVVIPAFNEARTISKVIEEVLKNNEVSELIVVDDGSTDKTVAKVNSFIKDARVKLIKHAKNKGKGAALKSGIGLAKNEVILILDADLKNITAAKIKKIYSPVLNDEVDLSRGSFRRSKGRVTEFAVKPMMSILYPGMNFDQPITGQICAKKSFLEKIDLERGYGVDIGILFDAIEDGQRIVEVDIGWIEHKENDDTKIAEMAAKVLETMIKKAGLIQHKYKLVIFTVDRSLLKPKTLSWIYSNLGITKDIEKLQDSLNRDKITFAKYAESVAGLFAGKNAEEVKRIVKKAPLTEYAQEVINALKRRKYKVAILSSNFSPIVGPVAAELGIDLLDCINLEIKNGVYTGKIAAYSARKWFGNELEESFKKAFKGILTKTKIKSHETVMIINGPAWLPVLEKSGLAIAFRPGSRNLKEKCDKTISILPEILALIE